jgi:hypothetical protein
MKQVAARKRKPVKPATLRGWKWALHKYVLPEMGDMHLAILGISETPWRKTRCGESQCENNSHDLLGS